MFIRSGGGSAWSSSSSIFSCDESSDTEDDDSGIDEWLGGVRDIKAAKPQMAKSGSRDEEADVDGGIDEWLSRVRNIKAVSKSDARHKDAPARRYKLPAATHVPLAAHGVILPSRRTWELSDKLAELEKDRLAVLEKNCASVFQPTHSMRELPTHSMRELSFVKPEVAKEDPSAERIAPCPPPRTTSAKAFPRIDRVDHHSAKLMMQCTDMVMSAPDMIMSALDFDYDDDLRSGNTHVDPPRDFASLARLHCLNSKDLNPQHQAPNLESRKPQRANQRAMKPKTN